MNLRRAAVVVSDFRGGPVPGPAAPPGPVRVRGGYLERLPLALVATGRVDRAEVWSYHRDDVSVRDGPGLPGLVRRSFRLDREDAPLASAAMAAHLRAHGPPAVLCTYGLGVDAATLDAAAGAFTLYNSIDAPALRVPLELSARFDLILIAAPWQSAEVRRLHPGKPTLELPVGPEFADGATFRPLGGPKDYDVVYVAAAQDYKRHDILFDLVSRRPGTRALCVMGYGERADALRAEAAARALAIDFVGPPGVGYEEVNALMNRARVGLVCGVDDGAPAILTEYMLAGLPVLANAALRCGLRYITPRTGVAAAAADFPRALDAMLAEPGRFRPRATALRRWTWRRSVRRLARYLPAGTAAPM